MELAGSGGLGSVNYEKKFSGTDTLAFTWRAGLSVAPIDKNNGAGIVFPVLVNMIYGPGKHKLELGIGQGITITTKGSFFALATGLIGYRFQSKEKRVFYRISYTPLVSYWVDLQVQHWAGMSIGYRIIKRNKA